MISEILAVDPIPRPIVDPSLMVAKAPGLPYRMRVQLQDDTMIKGHTYGIARTNNPSVGVTVLQVRHALAELYHTAQARAPWFPSRLLPQLVTAIVVLSQRVGSYPPGGTTASGNIERSTFSDRGVQYRVDLENLYGHNLRS